MKLARNPGDLRFATEAQALRRVGPPTVPEILDEGTWEGRPFLILELLEGLPLSTWLASQPGSGEAPLDEVARIFNSLCEAVQRVHVCGFVHRDLKPENVFLRRDGSLSLLDLGLARNSSGTTEAPINLTATGERPGTALYMSPEQCAGGGELDARTDVYSLGVLLFELFTGRPPFVGEMPEILRGHASLRPPRPSVLNPRAAPFDDVVLRCLAKQPTRRPASAAEVVAAFNRVVQSGSPFPTRAAPAVAAPGPSPSRSRALALMGVDSRAPVTELLAVAESEGGVIARLHRSHFIVAFPEHRSAGAGLKAAVRTAQRWGRDRRVVHLAELRVRPGQSSTRLAGAALEDADSWWGAAPKGNRIWVTPAAAPLLDHGGVVEVSGGFLELQEQAGLPAHDEVTDSPSLVGREELIEELERDAREALRQSVPTLVALCGEPGLGKTRLLEALAGVLTRVSGLRVLLLREGTPQPGRTERVLDELLRAAGTTLEAARAQAPPVAAEARRYTLARIAGQGLRRLAAEEPLVLLLDDAQWADPTVLDAIEFATLAEGHARLWICVTARPELLALRPRLGDRAGRFQACSLPPLSSLAARKLLVELLHPVEFLPEASLARLEDVSRGVPLYMVELARALRVSGAIRREPAGEGWSLAPDELLGLSAAPLFTQLSERALSALPENVRAMAQLCAVVGGELTIEEISAAQTELEADSEMVPFSSLDPEVGLSRLARAGILSMRDEGHYTFRHPLLREGLEAGISPRSRQRLHGAVLRSLLQRGGSDAVALSRRARHAAESGAREAALDAWLQLAEQARLAHRAAEAEQAYTAAIEQLSAGDDARRLKALAGRGKVRYRTHRYREAREDLSHAAALAMALGEKSVAAELLLEEATVRDWMEDWEGAEALTRRAMEVRAAPEGGSLALRLELAQARLELRDGQAEEPARRLKRVAEEATLAAEHEIRAVALILLGVALTFLGRLEEAEATFESALSHCQTTGDALHRAGAYINRGLLWQKRQDVERGLEDLRQILALARELGHAQLERLATFNLADFLHRLGRWEEALPLATRAHELAQRFFGEHRMLTDALLLARIAAARGALAEARRFLEAIEHQPLHEVGPGDRIYIRMIRQILADATAGSFSVAAWDALIQEGQEACAPDELLDVLLQAAASAASTGARDDCQRLLTEAERRAPFSPLWKARIVAIAASAQTPMLP